MNFIVKGGWIMAPILIGSVVALALTVERLWYFWRTRADMDTFARDVSVLVRAGDARGAFDLCVSESHPLAAVFAAGLERRDDPPHEVERVMEREATRQVGLMERNLPFLAVIVGLEPLLGFLGTILGLIEAFMSWERFSASVTVSQLAAGIYQAMITTAAGLVVAIPYFVVYHLFLGAATKRARGLEHYGDLLALELGRAGRRPAGTPR